MNCMYWFGCSNWQIFWITNFQCSGACRNRSVFSWYSWIILLSSLRNRVTNASLILQRLFIVTRGYLQVSRGWSEPFFEQGSWHQSHLRVRLRISGHSRSVSCSSRHAGCECLWTYTLLIHMNHGITVVLQFTTFIKFLISPSYLNVHIIRFSIVYYSFEIGYCVC